MFLEILIFINLSMDLALSIVFAINVSVELRAPTSLIETLTSDW